jgi:hypothetical protein
MAFSGVLISNPLQHLLLKYPFAKRLSSALLELLALEYLQDGSRTICLACWLG